MCKNCLRRNLNFPPVSVYLTQSKLVRTIKDLHECNVDQTLDGVSGDFFVGQMPELPASVTNKEEIFL